MNTKSILSASAFTIVYSLVVLLALIDIVIVALHHGTIQNESFENAAITTWLLSIFLLPFAFYATKGLSGKRYKTDSVSASQPARWKRIVYFIGYSACLVEVGVLICITLLVIVRKLY